MQHDAVVEKRVALSKAIHALACFGDDPAAFHSVETLLGNTSWEQAVPIITAACAGKPDMVLDFALKAADLKCLFDGLQQATSNAHAAAVVPLAPVAPVARRRIRRAPITMPRGATIWQRLMPRGSIKKRKMPRGATIWQRLRAARESSPAAPHERMMSNQCRESFEDGSFEDVPDVTPRSRRGLRTTADVPPQKRFDDMVRRIRAGRTVQNLLALMDMKLFHFGEEETISQAGSVQPRQGMFAQLHGREVMILNTWMRRNCHYADIAPVVPKPCSTRTDAWTTQPLLPPCRITELVNVGLHFSVIRVTKKTGVVLERRSTNLESFVSRDDLSLLAASKACALLLSRAATEVSAEGIKPQEVCTFLPRSAQHHLSQHPGHNTAPRADKGGELAVQWLLDEPLPRPLDLRPHRCTTCKNARTGGGSYFPVLWADVTATFPHAYLFHCPRKRTIRCTLSFLLHLLRLLYEELNTRGVRRRLIDALEANLIGVAAAHCVAHAFSLPTTVTSSSHQRQSIRS